MGVVFYQMLFGKRPLGEGQSQEQLMRDKVMLHAKEVRGDEGQEDAPRWVQTSLPLLGRGSG